jgi:hypothetical protein
VAGSASSYALSGLQVGSWPGPAVGQRHEGSRHAVALRLRSPGCRLAATASQRGWCCWWRSAAGAASQRGRRAGRQPDRTPARGSDTAKNLGYSQYSCRLTRRPACLRVCPAAARLWGSHLRCLPALLGSTPGICAAFQRCLPGVLPSALPSSPVSCLAKPLTVLGHSVTSQLTNPTGPTWPRQLPPSDNGTRAYL